MGRPPIKLLIIFLTLLIIAFIIGYFLFLPPKVIKLELVDRAENVSLNSVLIVKFDKPLRRQEIQPSIFPEAYGEWKFKDSLIKNHFYRTLVFEPALEFKPNTQYEARLENIKGFGFSKSSSFNFTFKTESTSQPVKIENENAKDSLLETPPKTETQQSETEITLLKIPLDWQDSPLSCEAASLKMALNFKGIHISENQIMEKIGTDLTDRKNNIWGDPYKIYVGNVDGQICETGYGVYWESVAKAANNWRQAEAFTDRNLENLIKEIQSGNPVIVWGTLPVSNLHDCSWRTQEGKYIKAYKETHVRLVVGFIGPPNEPTKIILNDPLAGRLYWPTSYFLTNWAAFDYSGVVIK